MSPPDPSALSPAKRALLEQRIRGRERAPARPVVARADSGPAPLSSAQGQLWYYSRLAPENPVYNEAVTIRKDGPFDPDAFARAFNEVVRRHEAWRSTFVVIDGKPMQIAAPAEPYELPVIDLRAVPDGEREHEAALLAVADSRRPYDLEHGPLIRPRLVRLRDDHHRLYLSMHHLVFDGVTLYRIVLPELISLYDAYTAQMPSPLADPPIQYADYAVWEQAAVESPEARGRLDYWRGHLGDAPTLQLPLDRPRPARQRFRGGMEGISLPGELAGRLRALGHEHGATLFQVVAAAFAVLLHGYSGQDDVVFGTVADLRRRPELEAMVGYCLTPLVLRAEMGDDPTFTELLGRMRREVVAALDHQVPFGQLVRELQPRRDPGANPIFGAMVVLEPPMVASDPSWSVHQMELEVGRAVGHAKLDLHIELDERPDGHIAGRLIYNSDIFDAATARRAVGHWHTLLQSIATEPARRISLLNMLTEPEQRRIILERTSTAADYPRDSSLHELVAAQIGRSPDAIAVVCGDDSVTFAELDRRASAVCDSVREAGAGTGSLVAICVERSVDMIAGLLGILRSGAAYVPLDPRHPAARLAFTMADCGATVLVTQASLLASLPAHGARVVCLDRVLDGATEVRRSAPAAAVTPDHLAYVMYTSGSSGNPKGVEVRHRSVVNLLNAMGRRPGLDSTDVVLAMTTYSFDMSVPDLWLPLVTGARMIIVPPAVARDAHLLGRLMAESGITFMQATPATWQMLVDGGWRGDPGLVALSGGDTLNERLAGRLLDRCATLWNAYGPTETTVWSTLERVRRGPPVSVGRPIANTRIHLLDHHGHPVPVGVNGEIFIGGDGVAAGYRNLPGLTAERFLDDPFVPGERMYRTGDQGRHHADGGLEFLGRLDDQVKIRGFRIEPGEVEAVLLGHGGVAAAVVVARDDSPGGRVLVAYIVPRDAMPPTAELRDLLRARLPDYMMPAAFVALERLPLTGNGKLDRAALPAPDRGRDPARSYTAPRSDLETKLARAWARTLRLERVGVDDDFFELGGHSLLAVRLLAEVEREVGLTVPVASLFDRGATVAGLAADIEAHTIHPNSELLVPVQPYGTRPALFFIHADEASMLTLRQFVGPLGFDQPVLGLLPERVGYRFDQARSVEDLSATMVAAVRSVQPHGPYYLAGYSMGGLFAYEVAGQLLAAGEEVGWLGLVDAGTPGLAARYVSMRQRLSRQRARAFGEASRKTWDIGSRSLRSLLARLGVSSTQPGHDFDWRGAAKLARKYICRGHAGPLDVFATNDMVLTTHSSSLGWADVHEGPLAVHQMLGDHFSMVQEPNVAILAEMLTLSLRSAQAAHAAAA